MFIDWQNPIRWQILNDELNRSLKLTAVHGRAHLAPGVRAALIDVVLGICKQNPHKKRVAILRGFDPTLDTLATVLSREGSLLLPFDKSDILDDAKRKDLFANDVAAIIASEDDPLLGLLLDLSALAKLAEEKRIPLVQVSHAHHRFLEMPKQFSRYFIHINGYGSDLAVVLSGDRYRWPVLFLDSTTFPANTIQRIEDGRKSGFINPAQVQAFESNVPGNGRAIFSAEVKRIQDRAIVFWADLDAHAVATRLAESVGVPLGEPGQSTTIESTSLHRWGGVRTMDWLKNHGFDEAKIRGTLILDQSRIDSSLPQLLENICREIRKIQAG